MANGHRLIINLQAYGKGLRKSRMVIIRNNGFLIGTYSPINDKNYFSTYSTHWAQGPISTAPFTHKFGSKHAIYNIHDIDIFNIANSMFKSHVHNFSCYKIISDKLTFF